MFCGVCGVKRVLVLILTCKPERFLPRLKLAECVLCACLGVPIGSQSCPIFPTQLLCLPARWPVPLGPSRTGRRKLLWTPLTALLCELQVVAPGGAQQLQGSRCGLAASVQDKSAN